MCINLKLHDGTMTKVVSIIIGDYEDSNNIQIKYKQKQIIYILT